ncbi:dihydrolipoamide acetyltransferase family protein [Arthrobacter sp. 2MCAF15]|uniref:dihydrolipoamide acetyltransferase family protein n=1 Tax=Arthrobacter sp. 2MCAF15 TaxID=3232984 RepID=UPI003F8DCA62
MINILMPRLSDTMEEGTIAVWHKKPGDRVDIGDILVEIETDKASMEYEAYDTGVLHNILVPEGEQATIGMIIAHLDDGSPKESKADASGTDTLQGPVIGEGNEPSTIGTPPAPAGLVDAPPPSAQTDETTTERTKPNTADSQRLFATPLARRLARERAIDLQHITGSGPGGRIVRADIEDALARQSPVPTSDAVAAPAEALATAGPVGSTDARQSTVVAFDKTRQVISRRLTESSSTAPHFYVTSIADVEELLALRADLNAHIESTGRAKISVNDLLVRACAIALRKHPEVNASYSPENRGQTLLHGRVNIGMAVASSTGLVVPVIADADQKTASQIATESHRLAGLAKDRKLSATDMSGGTFTISNLGMYGVEQFTAIINPPEGAIIAVGAAQPEPVAIDGALEIRHRMRYTLSADHRIIDGALAAQFLATLTELLRHPLDIIA